MAFDPNAYLNEGKNPSGFDPDAYLGIQSGGGKPPLGFVAKQVFNLTPMAHVSKNLPILGGVLGSAGGPLGAAAGAGVGQIANNMIGIASGDPNAPRTAMGAALPAMGQAIMGGVGQEPEVLKDIPGVPQVAQKLGGLASRAGKSVGNFAARVGEAASGVKAQDIKQLFRNPGTLFKAGARDAAGRAIGEAKLAAGVNPGVTGDIASFTPSNVAKATNVAKTGEQALSNVTEALSKEEKPSVGDIGDALKNISKQIRAGLRAGEDTSELQNIQAHLNSTLEQVAPAIQEARQAFAPLAQRDKFLKLFPTNKDGTISKANLFYLNTIAKGATIPFRAPLTTGLATSAAGGAAKGLNAIAQNPQARQVLLQVLQRLRQGKGE